MFVQIADAHDPVNRRFRSVRLPSRLGHLDSIIHELIDWASEPEDIDEEGMCLYFALVEGEEALTLLLEPHRLPPGSRQFLLDIFGPLGEVSPEHWPAHMSALDSRGLSLPFPGSGSSAYLLGMGPASPE